MAASTFCVFLLPYVPRTPHHSTPILSSKYRNFLTDLFDSLRFGTSRLGGVTSQIQNSSPFSLKTPFPYRTRIDVELRTLKVVFTGSVKIEDRRYRSTCRPLKFVPNDVLNIMTLSLITNQGENRTLTETSSNMQPQPTQLRILCLLNVVELGCFVTLDLQEEDETVTSTYSDVMTPSEGSFVYFRFK